MQENKLKAKRTSSKLNVEKKETNIRSQYSVNSFIGFKIKRGKLIKKKCRMQFNKVTKKCHPRQVGETAERHHARWVLVLEFYLYRLNKLLLYDLNEIK